MIWKISVFKWFQIKDDLRGLVFWRYDGGQVEVKIESNYVHFSYIKKLIEG